MGWWTRVQSECDILSVFRIFDPSDDDAGRAILPAQAVCFSPETEFCIASAVLRRLDIPALLGVKTYPYDDISDPERRALYCRERDIITDRDGMAEALNLSPNRVSELTIRGQLVSANKHPLRYAVKHNVECYANYKWALDKEFFSRLTNLPPEGEEN